VETACDLMERSFLSFDTPCWVPDPGFNFVSLFLLQNRGMTFPQIKKFLGSFKAIVREKVIDPSKTEASPELIARLRRDAQYDRPHAPEREVIEVAPARQYLAAEKYWLSELSHELGNGSPEPPNEAPAGHPAPRANGAPSRTEICPVDIDALHDRPSNEILLAAWAAAAFGCGGVDDFVCEVECEGAPLFPIRTSLQAETKIGQLAARLSDKLQQGRQHAAYWPTIRDKVLPTAIRSPARFAFRMAQSGLPPAPHSDLALVIETEPAFGAHLELARELDAAVVRAMSRMLPIAVTCARQQPDTTLGELIGEQLRSDAARRKPQRTSPPGTVAAAELGAQGV
jgi:hypothetical protein